VVVPFAEASHNHLIAGIARDAGLLHVQADEGLASTQSATRRICGSADGEGGFPSAAGAGRKVGGAGLASLSIGSSIE